MAKKRSDFSEQEQHIATTLATETPRGVVLAAHGYLDRQLEDLLRERFRVSKGTTDKLIKWLLVGGPQAPLGSFYVKMVMARTLRLLDNESLCALRKLNELRRHFAHHPGGVTLTERRVEDIYNLMNSKCKSWVQEVSKSGLVVATELSVAHVRFIYTSLSLVMMLDEAIGWAISERPLPGIWSE